MLRCTALALVVSVALSAIAPAHAQALYAPAAEDIAPAATLPSEPIATPMPTIDATAAAVSEDLLKPGEFRWLGSAQGAGSLVILVSLAEQRATVFRNGQAVAVTTVSTGMPGRETPTGVYPILAKEKMHHSNLYDNAPMPFMQRLTWDGVALHAGRIPGRAASHGCVRLPRQFAQQLFSITARGQTVIISDDASVEALLRAGAPAFLASQIGRRNDTDDGGLETTTPAGGDDSALDAGSISYQDNASRSGGSPK